MSYRMNDLWKFGISGDLPIIFVKIKNIEDIYVIEEVIGCFEYYRAKNIRVDLVILNEESDVYEKYVRESIEEVISNKQLQFLLNAHGGIFLIDKTSVIKEDLDCIEFKARVVIDSKKGGINNFLRENEENLKSLNTSNVFRKIESEPMQVFDNETANDLEFIL